MTQKHFEKLHLAISDISDILKSNGFKGCNLYQMEEAELKRYSFPELAVDSNGSRLHVGEWYVVVRCENDYRYLINVDGLSVLSACAEVLNFIQYK